MEKAKIVMICFYLFYRMGMLIAVYLTQGFSQYFSGNQYLNFSFVFLGPVILVGILALIKLSGGRTRQTA